MSANLPTFELSECELSTFIIGVHNYNAVIVLDTHQIGVVGGNGNEILLYTNDATKRSCTHLVQWILKRLVSSGVSCDGKQSLAWITRGKSIIFLIIRFKLFRLNSVPVHIYIIATNIYV